MLKKLHCEKKKQLWQKYVILEESLDKNWEAVTHKVLMYY